MKKHYKFLKRTLAIVLSLSLCFFASGPVNIHAADLSLTEDELFLLNAGTPLDEIQSMDKDIMAYIVNELKKCDEPLSYISVEDAMQIQPLSSEILTGINYTVSAYREGTSYVHIFPTYEFTTDKQPKGKDCFAYALGDAFAPVEDGFTGALWYKDYTMSNWRISHNLIANQENLFGAEYSGSQLGSPQYAMKFKGCLGVKAKLTGKSDNRISMSYLYNPNKHNFSVSFSVGAVGISASGIFGNSYCSSKLMYVNF